MNQKILIKTVGKENDQTSFIEAWLESNCKMYVLSPCLECQDTPSFFTMKDACQKLFMVDIAIMKLLKNELNRLAGPQTSMLVANTKKDVLRKKQGWEYQLLLITNKIKGVFKSLNKMVLGVQLLIFSKSFCC